MNAEIFTRASLVFNALTAIINSSWLSAAGGVGSALVATTRRWFSSAIISKKRYSIRNYKPKRIPQLMWRECTPRAFLSGHIKKIWEVDPLVCPKCTGEMKILSFIYKRTVIKKILTHLNLYEEKGDQRAPPSQKVENIERIKVVSYDDGWPEYEESV